MTLPDPMRTAALRLGFLGLLPFASLAVASLAGGDDLRAIANPALLAYGATILSFLGGIHWGLVLARPFLAPRELYTMLGVGVIPQLLGWVALMVPALPGHVLCAGGLVLFLVADREAVRRGLAPAWFMQLRWPLSCGAAIAMLVGAAAT
jgi:hypothetical protein